MEDVVIEGNTIAQAKIGIELGPRCAGIVVRNNALRDVEHPFLGEGLKAARLEGNQLPKPDERDKGKETP